MNDELTPELEDALKKLPRERMPEGLQAKVKDAMREHGYLEKRRRVVAVTSGRVAGLVAACVGLVIGAYSIGLQHGDGGGAVLPAVAPAQRDDVAGAIEQEAETPGAVAPKTGAPAAKKDLRADVEAEPAPRAETGTAPDVKRETTAARSLEPESEPVAADDIDGDGAAPAPAPDREKRITAAENFAAPEEAAQADAPAAQRMMSLSTEKTQPQTAGGMPDAAGWPMRFVIDGVPFVIDAPDSVRASRDPRSGMVFIYTSDGVIRIRPGGP